MNAHDDIVKQFLADQHAEGELLPKSYFWDLFGLKEPKGMVKVSEVEKANFAFLSCMEKLKDALLNNHKADLVSNGKRNYVLLHLKDRIRVAVKDTTASLRKHLNKGAKRLENIPNVENLSYTEQRHRDYALQMFEAMKRDLRATPRYPKE